MAQAAHSLLGASSSERWLNCPGSIALSVGMPTGENVYARTGNCAHDIAEACLNTRKRALEFLGEEMPGYEDIEVDETMCDAVQDYLDMVNGEIEKYTDEGHTDHILLVEHRFDLTQLFPGMFGTCDAVLYFPAWRKLMVIDYKNGWVGVGVLGNTQIMYYALGAIYTKDNWAIDEVELVIVQPRDNQGGAVKRWTVGMDELMDFKKRLIAGAKETKKEKAKTCAGKHCVYCPANVGIKCQTIKTYCEELVMAKTNLDGDLIPTPVELMPLDKLRTLWDNAKVLEAHVKNAKKYIHTQAIAGNLIPGTKLVEGRHGRRFWKDSKTIREKLKKLIDIGYDLGDIIEHRLRSPAQIEAHLPKAERKVLEPLWAKGPAGVSLVDESDKRPSIKVADGREFDVFD